MNYWLMKSEPSTFGIDALARAKGQSTSWDGVRNYQARNFMRDSMRPGDLAFFYHSSCAVPGIAGVMKVASETYPDASAFDKRDDHYDPDSDQANPRWYVVDVKLERKFEHIITLDRLRAHAKDKLRELLILRRGNRLSITPVSKTDWRFILSLEETQ
ncbi:MAG: EVE domain-containing protein [Candidatus Obscuribacterales bacterium]|nr:EVE domain-containing protein [Steroidobacteraceae bacterium]